MSHFKGLDRTKTPYVPGALVKEWMAETEALRQKVMREIMCPNCGFPMVYGVPCSTPARKDP